MKSKFYREFEGLLSAGNTRVCFLSLAHPALDKRVFDKEARSLADVGFEVVHLCPQSPGEPLGRWEKDGVSVETYPRLPGIRGRLAQFRNVYARARALNADIYHCNEVDSWGLGVLLRIVTGRICVADIHEDYPSTFAESRFPRLLQPLVQAFVRLVYACLTPFTARVVLAKRSVARDFWFARRKLVLVQNFTPLSVIASKGGAAPPDRSGPPVLVHLGLISRIRGWPQLLDAMVTMKRKDARLHVIGDFNDGTLPEFLERARVLGLADRIRVDQWMPFSQAFERLQKADVGLVLFQPGTQNHVFALPHKMFDYMLARLPVLAPAFAIEVREIIRESQSGVLVDPARPDEIAQALDRLLDENAWRGKLGDNGYRAVHEKYNWEREAQTLIGMYRELTRVSR
jgi:glycosyltransferase involved in cell wall biosynthesis